MENSKAQSNQLQSRNIKERVINKNKNNYKNIQKLEIKAKAKKNLKYNINLNNKMIKYSNNK